MASLQLLQFVMRRLLSLALLLVAAPSALGAGDEYPRVWLNPGFFTHHFRRGDFRGDNYGLGVEVAFSARHAGLAGSFINSDRERSRYAGYHWRPWHRQAGPVHFSAGLVVGLVDGYSSTNDGGWFPAALPVVSAEYGIAGANLAFIPHPKNGAALALQLKLRIW
jgi:hypothetical protein